MAARTRCTVSPAIRTARGAGLFITREMHDEDMQLIKELGANTIRLAHYQHDQYFYDLCDEVGMVVWAEILTSRSTCQTAAPTPSAR